MPFPLTKSIVLLDDEKSYTELMCQLLSNELDCPVHGFDRPLAALAALPAIRPGVVVTDYFMPQIDGLEFIRRATPIVPGASFVIITGHNLTEHHAELGQLAALRGVMGKPFGWRTLADAILRAWPTEIPPPGPRADDPSI